MKNNFAQRWTQTHDPEIKSLMLYQSQDPETKTLRLRVSCSTNHKTINAKAEENHQGATPGLFPFPPISKKFSFPFVTSTSSAVAFIHCQISGTR